MSLCRYLLLIAAASVLSLAYPTPVRAQAQSTLPNDVVGATSSLSPDQSKKISQYIQDRTSELTGSDSVQRSRARQELMDPLSFPGSTPIFKTAYSTALSSALTPLAQQGDAEVRLNVMIVASRLIDPGVVAIIEAGLQDANSPVRYWAAKTIANVGKTLSPAQQLQVLTDLTNAWGKELSSLVLGQMLLGMNSLTIPQAQALVLATLNQRVAVHADPAISFHADFAGLQGVCVRMVGGNTAPPTADVKNLTIVLFRYMDVITKIFEQKRAVDVNEGDMRLMLQLVANYLNWAGGQLLTGKPNPPKLPEGVDPLVKASDWQSIRLRVEEWRNLLTGPVLQFKADDLQVPQIAGGPAASAGKLISFS